MEKDNYVLVDKLSKDIKSLEKRIKHINIENLKKTSIRNIKIFGRLMQLIGPYVLAALIPFASQSILFDIPFYPEKVKQEINYHVELDSNGVITLQSQYADFDEEKNRLYFCSEWILSQDGLYKRTVKTYRIKEKLLDLDELKLLIMKDDLSLEDILEEPISTIVETKNIVTEEELNNSPYIRINYYYENGDDYIIVNQSFGENLAWSLLYLFVVSITEYGVYRYRDEISSFDIYDCIELLKERYQKTDINILEKKLEIKKKNYQRLTGDNYE